MGALLRKDLLFTLRPWQLDSTVKTYTLNYYINYLVIDQLKEQSVRILPLYFFMEDRTRQITPSKYSSSNRLIVAATRS